MLSFTVTDINGTITKLMNLGAELDGPIKYEIHGKVCKYHSVLFQLVPFNFVCYTVCAGIKKLSSTHALALLLFKVTCSKPSRDFHYVYGLLIPNISLQSLKLKIEKTETGSLKLEISLKDVIFV